MEQAIALHTAFMEPSVKKAIDIKMLLSFEEQELIEKVDKLLEPFKSATVILSSETEPTLPAVMPLSLGEIRRTVGLVRRFLLLV